MATWHAFEKVTPDLATGVRKLLYQFGIGLGYLATVRADGGPRLHPVCPVIDGGGLFLFVVDSPRRGDLERDGRYALHSYPGEDVDDEAYLAGTATLVEDPSIWQRVAEAYHHPPQEDWLLFELDIERSMVARYQERGQWPPEYTKWVDDGMV